MEERILEIHWDQLMEGAFQFPDIETKEIEVMNEAKEFIDSILEQTLSSEYLLNLSNEVFYKAHDIVNGDESNPLIEVAVQEIDSDAWGNLIGKFLRCRQTIDPSVEEEFI